MRTTTRAVAAALTLLALPSAALAHPAPSRAPALAFTVAVASITRVVVPVTDAPTWTGVYRLTLDDGGIELAPARVVVERVDDMLVGTLLIDAHGIALTHMTIDGETLRAELPTSDGRGALALRLTDRGIAGTLTVGRRVWTFIGERSL